MKNVRPRIVTQNIEVVFATRDDATVDLGDLYGSASEVRLYKHVAERIDDA